MQVQSTGKCFYSMAVAAVRVCSLELDYAILSYSDPGVAQSGSQVRRVGWKQFNDSDVE